jgi:hypothetical protein
LVVRYDLVPLLDRPDEALGLSQAELDSGDEVEVLERDAIWTRVRTPAGRAGWIPAMTLTSVDPTVYEPAAETPPAEDIDGAAGQDDQPALETLLAIAAERRARMDAQARVAPDEPRKAPAGTRSGHVRKSRKANRRTSRAEHH